jgi:PAS domain-containing protein
MEPNRELATWLLGQRHQIERALITRLGPAAPRASGPEAETLRRFRTFATTTLMRGSAAAPALDGLRPSERRVMALLEAWAQAAAEQAGARGAELRAALADPLDRFRLAVRGTSSGRKAKGSPRVSRRIVTAAIDRISDPFLAIDVHDGTIVDANPAAGAILGVARDTLLGIELGSFIPEVAGTCWWTALDAISENSDSERFRARLRDVAGIEFELEASATRFTTRGRTLALTLLRVASTSSS